MLNVRTTFSSIFGILFILSISFTAFAQQEQQVGAALSQSQFMQILDKIDESEDEMRKHVDKKFDELDKKFDEKFDKLDEKVDEIKTDVAVLNARVNQMKKDNSPKNIAKLSRTTLIRLKNYTNKKIIVLLIACAPFTQKPIIINISIFQPRVSQKAVSTLKRSPTLTNPFRP